MTDTRELVERVDAIWNSSYDESYKWHKTDELAREFIATIESLTSRLAALEADAGRYKWLRDECYLNQFWDGYIDASIDIAIDAAMTDAARREGEP